MTNALSPRILQPSDSNQNWSWDRPLPALGHTAVDFERRVDHDRLRRYRLSRAKNALKNSTCGSCLLYTSPSPRDYAASRMPSSA